jgi:hypothetical protein
MLKLQSLNAQLVSLKLAFDEAIMRGDSLEEVRKIYIQIKELETLVAEREIFLLKRSQEGSENKES